MYFPYFCTCAKYGSFLWSLGWGWTCNVFPTHAVQGAEVGVDASAKSTSRTPRRASLRTSIPSVLLYFLMAIQKTCETCERSVMDQKGPSLKWSGCGCHGQALLKFASVVLFLSPKAVIGLILIHREQKYNQMWVITLALHI